MRNDRSERRGGFNRERPSNNRFSERSGSRDGFRPRPSGKRFDERSGGFEERESRRFERRPMEMHDVTCDKCGKACQVPFRPTGDKPVFCSDCFKKNDSPRSQERSSSGSAGISPEQFKKLNAKLDKILEILEGAVVEEVDEEDEEQEEETDEPSEEETEAASEKTSEE